MRITLLRSSGDTSKIEHDFLWPVRACRRQLEDLGYEVSITDRVDDALTDCDALGILSTWVRHHGREEGRLDELQAIINDFPGSYYFDIADSAGGLNSACFSLCQRYFKKQIYTDRTFYTNPNSRESRMHFDYYIRNHECVHDMVSWSTIPTNYADVSQSFFDNIKISWNVGIGDYRTFGTHAARLTQKVFSLQLAVLKTAVTLPLLSTRFDFSPFDARDVDVVACFSDYEGLAEPVHCHRRQSLDAVHAGESRWDAVSGFLSVRDYNALLARSKGMVSPFGWGEMTYKDFEAFINGIALLKPDMRHIETWPDYFVADETYVPYRWDAADLGAVIERALAADGLLEQIARHGQDRFRSYSVLENPEPFLERFQEVFEASERQPEPA